MSNHQMDLWHDSLSDALLAVVMGAGGPKKIGSEMWQTLSPDDAGRKLSNCLNKDHQQKLTLDEIEFLIKKSRQSGIHTVMTYLASVCGYEPPKPVNPENEKERLYREFIHAVQLQAQLVRQMGVFNG